MNQEEIWKDVKGYEGMYVISSTGKVKSLKFNREKILKNQLDPYGYHIVGLSKNGKIRTKRVHQLIAIAFLDHKPCGINIVVDHIDNDKLNNNLNNLQLITHRENCSKDRKGYSSKHVGVGWCKKTKKWRSRIQFNKREIVIGYFSLEQEAATAYNDSLNEITKNKNFRNNNHD